MLEKIINLNFIPLMDQLNGLMNGYCRYLESLDKEDSPDITILMAYKDRMKQLMDEIREMLP